jgi:hypothetical protein
MSYMITYTQVKRAKRFAFLSLALTAFTLGTAIHASAASFITKNECNFETDFEEFGISRPKLTGTDDPLNERVKRVTDPDGTGKSFRVILLKSDDQNPAFYTSQGTAARSWISNWPDSGLGYRFSVGSKVRYTWKIRTTSAKPILNACFAQVISDGTRPKDPQTDKPLWMLKTDANRNVYLSIHYDNDQPDLLKSIGRTLPVDKWVKFRVTFNFQTGGKSDVYVESWVVDDSGAQTDFKDYPVGKPLSGLNYDSHLTWRKCHWDGGVYRWKGKTPVTDCQVYIDDFKVEQYQ